MSRTPVSSNFKGASLSVIFFELSDSTLINAPLPRYRWKSIEGFVPGFAGVDFWIGRDEVMFSLAVGSFGRRALSNFFSSDRMLWRLSQLRSLGSKEILWVESML